MDDILRVAVRADGWTGNKLRLFFASGSGNEVWTLTLDRSAGIGEARRDGDIPPTPQATNGRAGVADEPLLPEREVPQPPSQCGEISGDENPV